MPGFDIQITTTADLAGINKTSEALDDVSRKTDKAGEATEKHNVSERERHRIFGELNRILPGVGELLHGLSSESVLGPAVLGGAAAIEIFSKFKEVLQEVETEARKTFSTITSSVINAHSEIVKLHTSNDEFFQSLRRHQQEAQTSNAFDAAMKQIEEQLEAQKKVLDEQKQLELTSIGAEEQAGRITPEYATSRRTQVEQFYRDAATGRGTAANRQEQQLRGQRITDLEQRLAQLMDDLHRVQDVNTGQGAVGRNATIEQLKDFIKDLTDKFQKTGGEGSATATEVNLAPAVRRLLVGEHGAETVAANDVNYANFTKTAQEWIDTLERDKQLRENSQGKYEELINQTSSQLEQLRAQQTEAQQHAQITQGAAAQIAQLQHTQDSFKQLSSLGVFGNPAGADQIFDRGVAAIQAGQRLQRGQRLSDDQQEAIRLLDQLLNALQWGPQIIQHLEHSVKINESLIAYTNTIGIRLAQLEQQMKTGAIVNHQ